MQYAARGSNQACKGWASWIRKRDIASRGASNRHAPGRDSEGPKAVGTIVEFEVLVAGHVVIVDASRS